MKKLIVTTLLLFSLYKGIAQELSYGVITGWNFYDLEINGPFSGGAAISSLNYGGYAEYNLNNRIGVKFNLIYSNLTEDYIYYVKRGLYDSYDEVEMSALNFQPLLKFDVSKEYNKGFYLLAGLQFTNVSVKDNFYEAFYKKNYYSGLFGFGVNFLNHFGTEVIITRNLSNTLTSSANTAQNYGAYFNFTVNIESVINGK